jgi:glycosyltransferase involved in cell wall biosynthesis
MDHQQLDLTDQAPLGVIIPVFNEQASLGHTLRRVLAQPCVRQVIVVDDGSGDRSLEIAEAFTGDPRVVVSRHARNLGKGAALRTGLAMIDTPIVIIQDADLEYDPAEYPKLIGPIVEGRADVVYGVRGFAGHTAFSFWYVLGNRLVTTVANVLFNCYIHDLATGFKAMRTELLRRLRFGGHGFDVDPQITARVLRLGYRIHEVPISYYARSRADGKKVSWRDGVIALVTLVRIRLTPGRMLFGQDQYHAARVVPIAAAPQLTPLPGEGALDQADTVVASETRR